MTTTKEKRQSFAPGDTIMDVLLTMSEGNPGGMTVLGELLKSDANLGFWLVLDLDDMNIRGSQIWVGFKDHCKEDLHTFIAAVRRRDPEMVKTINAAFAYDKDAPQAVTHGGSNRGN